MVVWKGEDLYMSGEGIREKRWEYLSSRENSAIYSHWFGLQREGFP